MRMMSYRMFIGLALLLITLSKAFIGGVTATKASPPIHQAGHTDSPAGDSAKPDVRDGDVLLVRGNTDRSRIVLSASVGHPLYSHCGLIVTKEGQPFVVHAAPPEQHGRVGGYVEMIRLDDFLRSPTVEAAAIFRYPSLAVASRAAAIARGYAESHVPFDGAFDLRSEDRLYCSELVYKAYLRSGGIDLVDGRFDQPPLSLLGDRMVLPASLAESRHLRFCFLLQHP